MTALAVQERFRPKRFWPWSSGPFYRLTITSIHDLHGILAFDVLNDLNGALWNMARDSTGRLNGLNVYSTGIS